MEDGASTAIVFSLCCHQLPRLRPLRWGDWACLSISLHRCVHGPSCFVISALPSCTSRSACFVRPRWFFQKTCHVRLTV